MKNRIELSVVLRPARRGGWLASVQLLSAGACRTHLIRAPGLDRPAVEALALEQAGRMLREAK